MINRETIKIEKTAFEGKLRGYYLRATYLEEPKGEAVIEIFKDDIIVREFLFPAYKIWNIAAHADDIIDGLEQKSDSGLYIAGSTGYWKEDEQEEEHPTNKEKFDGNYLPDPD